MRFLHLLTYLLVFQAMAVEATISVIENATLAAGFDASANIFTLTDKHTGQTFVTGGKLGGVVTSTSVTGMTNAIFGAGNKIVVTQPDGSMTSLELYNSLPFLLLRKTIRNDGPGEVDLQKVIPATFTLTLERQAEALKTMGTGGLLAPDQNPGSYLFLACADPVTRRGIVTGFISQYRGSGVIFSSVEHNTVIIRAQLEHGHLIIPAGQSVELDTLAIGHFADARLGSEELADAIARQHQITLRPKTAVYCSWYAEGREHGRAGTEASTRELARFIIDNRLKDFGLDVVQLDDGWQDGPQRHGPSSEFDRVNPNGPYRNGITSIARDIEKQNLVFGLWWLPFGRNHMETNYGDKQDWFVKQSNGEPLRQRSFGGTCLDATHPVVQAHLRSLAKTIRGWGVKYFKMDGLSAGAGVDHAYINDGYKEDHLASCQPLHNRFKTNIEAMRLGLQTIREGAGADVFFSGCCAAQNMRILSGSIGLVDSMRVGPDFNHDGQGIRSGPLRGSRLYFMNGKIWWNDPDPTKVRTSNEECEGDRSANGAVSLDQARLTSSWVAIADQFFLISDWLPNLPADRLDILKRTMASHGASSRPVDYFDHSLANTWLVTDTKSGVRRDVLGLFNFDETLLVIDHTFSKIGLDPEKTYHAFDFWANRPLPALKGSYHDTVAPHSCRVIALRSKEDHPVLVSTSRHVTQGIVDVASETWSADSATLSVSSTVLANDPYEARIAGLNGRVTWAWVTATVSDADQAAGVTITPRPMATGEPGWLRLTISAKDNRCVKWTVKFTEGTTCTSKNH